MSDCRKVIHKIAQISQTQECKASHRSRLYACLLRRLGISIWISQNYNRYANAAAALDPMIPLSEQIEAHRDRMWRRDEELRVESALDAERFIEDVGFANTLTDTRRSGPSLYIAVCGRRDVSLPRNVQKDEETRLTWYLKDEVMRRGRVYYAKLAGGRSMLVAPRLISHFAAVWMPRRKDEVQVLSDAAQRILKVLRREHELATTDLRAESGVTERAAFTRALDELQRQMKVIPQDVIYQPFSYIWTLAEDRWPAELRKRIARKTALREIARAYLAGAGMSLLGETARASGLSRVEAGSGNHQLVDEGYAIRIKRGVYKLGSLNNG
jgi:hypothetical protein